MQNAAAMRESNRVADVDEPVEQVTEFLGRGIGLGMTAVVLRHRVLEAGAVDEPHRVIRLAVVVRSQAVDGDDSGMLQTAADLGLEGEPRAEFGVPGQFVLDFLERDDASEFLVQRLVDATHPAFGVLSQNAVASAPARARFGPLGAVERHGVGDGREVGEVRVVEPREFVAERSDRG